LKACLTEKQKQKWRDKVELMKFKIACCLDLAYETAEQIWRLAGEGKPWSWRKIHRKWLVFKSVPRSPSRIAERILREA